MKTRNYQEEEVADLSRQVFLQIRKVGIKRNKRIQYHAELTLFKPLELEKYIGSPRRFRSFGELATTLRRETGVAYGRLQDAFRCYAGGKPAGLTLDLEDDQIRHLGFNLPV